MDHYDDIQNALKGLGYRGLHCPRTGRNGDGCSTFVRSALCRFDGYALWEFHLACKHHEDAAATIISFGHFRIARCLPFLFQKKRKEGRKNSRLPYNSALLSSCPVLGCCRFELFQFAEKGLRDNVALLTKVRFIIRSPNHDGYPLSGPGCFIFILHMRIFLAETEKKKSRKTGMAQHSAALLLVILAF